MKEEPRSTREIDGEGRSDLGLRPGGVVVQGAKNAKRTAGLKPYSSYKDSGVEWLGKIPAAWEVKPLKHLTAFSTGWTPPTGRENLYGGQHFWANIGDLGPRILCATQKTISDQAIREARLRIVAAGSLLFSFKLSVGMVSIVGADMYTNEAIAAFAPSERIDTLYLYWAAPLLVPRNAQENIYGAPLLNRERIANARLLSPPVVEQRAIAAFLDRQTTKIDALVAKKERLIELLQEKRTTIIARAVTKGLDPNVPMKNSGVEWLGEIPAHWEVKPLKRAIRFIEGPGILAQDFMVEGIPLLRISGIGGRTVSLSGCNFLPPKLVDQRWSHFRVEVGDLLISGSASTGFCSEVDQTTAGSIP